MQWTRHQPAALHEVSGVCHFLHTQDTPLSANERENPFVKMSTGLMLDHRLNAGLLLDCWSNIVLISLEQESVIAGSFLLMLVEIIVPESVQNFAPTVHVVCLPPCLPIFLLTLFSPKGVNPCLPRSVDKKRLGRQNCIAPSEQQNESTVTVHLSKMHCTPLERHDCGKINHATRQGGLWMKEEEVGMESMKV